MNLFSDLFRGKDWIKKLPRGKHKLSRYHWFNMVSPSPWPFLLGTNALPIVLGLIGCMQGINTGFEMLIAGFISFFFIFALWNRDIIRESTFMGVHTKQVDANTILGFKLFLFSEIMLFFSFFWAHLYSALYPSVFIGLSWPPVGLSDLLLDPFDIPLTNTVILVYSGLTVTLSHLYLRRGSIFLSAIALIVTILFGLAFLYIQYTEYAHAEFDISDGIYGCTFYMLTGFHGGHVIIGVSALIITLIRLIELHFSSYSHTGYKLALIYWHFVDVVWIFVFLIVYVLGFDLTYPNIIYYNIHDTVGCRELGCVVNLDRALFGKLFLLTTTTTTFLYEPWLYSSADGFDCPKGPLSSEFYLYYHRAVWLTECYNQYIKEAFKGELKKSGMWFDSKNTTYVSGPEATHYSVFTLQEETKNYYNYLINDQSDLSTDQSLNIANHLYTLMDYYQILYNDFFSNEAYMEADYSNYIKYVDINNYNKIACDFYLNILEDKDKEFFENPNISDEAKYARDALYYAKYVENMIKYCKKLGINSREDFIYIISYRNYFNPMQASAGEVEGRLRVDYVNIFKDLLYTIKGLSREEDCALTRTLPRFKDVKKISTIHVWD